MAAEPAMRPTGEPLAEVLDRATGARRIEADELVALLAEVSGADPVVWAGRIVGFGAHEYRYETGHGGVAPLLAFAPGRAHHTLYLESGFAERWGDLVDALGPHRSSVACLYVTRLANVDRDVLRAMLERSVAETLAR
ncbi:DUF1801 domain-containing protein [Agrococcus jejuensis]|uniref:YdhG-like domain-containing protein n=1 Tax=Agrococcus jejuensis TaxID=399736 RepID=A0A1G8H3C8_9MICO|nr:DUF1801 domain-containing protein [Agrococcus jejuensis]SDI01182.1 hypothetical protein SAMN04489720_3197 [Agrococcus jejuensis]